MIMLSDLLRFTLVDQGGHRAALQDLTVDLAAGDYPPVTAALLHVPQTGHVLLPWAAVNTIDWRAGRIVVNDLDAAPATAADALTGTVLLKRDVQDTLVLDLVHKTTALANDLWLTADGKQLRLGAADISKWAVLRRLARGRLGRGSSRLLIDWKHVEFLRGDPRAARAGRDYHRRVTRLQPGEIARLVDALPYLHAAEMLTLIPDGLAADALEVMAVERQIQIFEELDEDQALRLLPLMAPDAAADLLGRLDPQLVERYLRSLAPVPRDRLVDLLQYPADSAGGIMTNDVLVVARTLRVAATREALLPHLKDPDFAYYVYVVDDLVTRRLCGVLTLRSLLLAADDQPLEELMRTNLETVRPLEAAVAAAHRIAENHLAAVPVVDQTGRLLGTITADAAIIQIAPRSWRDQAPRVFS